MTAHLFKLLVSLTLAHLSPNVVYASDSTNQHASKETVLYRLGFGSCQNEKVENLFLTGGAFSERKFDNFIFMGDNVYADAMLRSLSDVTKQWRKVFQVILRSLFLKDRANKAPSTIDQISSSYSILLSNPDFKKFISSITDLSMMWDDHDYGQNDGDKHYIHKLESQEAFIDFYLAVKGMTKNGQSRNHLLPVANLKQRSTGLYHRQVISLPNEVRLEIYLLDLRSQKDSYGTIGGDFLGDSQWKWLETSLKEQELFREQNPDIAVSTIMVSTIQVFSSRFWEESWTKFPAAKSRLLELLGRFANPVILSGDVHFAEISTFKAAGMTLSEITSSGLTHSAGVWPIDNQIGEMLIDSTEGAGQHTRENYLGLNAGSIEITRHDDKDAEDTRSKPHYSLNFKLFSPDNVNRLTKTLHLVPLLQQPFVDWAEVARTNQTLPVLFQVVYPVIAALALSTVVTISYRIFRSASGAKKDKNKKE